MSTKNVTLKEKVNGAAGNVLFPATTTPNVYDSAKSQALSQTLVNTPDYEALGFAKFSTATAYNTGDKVYKDNGLYRFIADKTAGEWDVAKVEPWSIEQEIEEVDDAIRSLIPAQASADNKLADKAYVNDKVSTDTATFRGTFNLVTDLELTTEATQGQIATALGTAISGEDKNDYAFVQIPTSDATPTEIARIDRYKYTGLQWAFEYSLNNSGFTAEQWAAINSGITSSLVAAFGAKYDKPAGGIPASDMNTNTFDAEPTAGSDNLVKSSGIYKVDENNKAFSQILSESIGTEGPSKFIGNINSSGNWVNVANSIVTFYLFNISPNDTLTITSGNLSTVYAFLKNYQTPVQGTPADFCSGTSRESIPAKTTVTLSVPSDAKFLYLYHNSSDGNDYSPSSVLINSKEFIKDNLTEKTDKLVNNVNILNDTIKNNIAFHYKLNGVNDSYVNFNKPISLKSDGDSLEILCEPLLSNDTTSFAFSSSGLSSNNYYAIKLDRRLVGIRSIDGTWIYTGTLTDSKIIKLKLEYRDSKIFIYRNDILISTYNSQKEIQVSSLGNGGNGSYGYWSGEVYYIKYNNLDYLNPLFASNSNNCDLMQSPKSLPKGVLKFVYDADTPYFVFYSRLGNTNKYFSFVVGLSVNNDDLVYLKEWRLSSGGYYEYINGTFVKLYDTIYVNENEMAMAISGAIDHTGGVHGDERIDVDSSCFVEFFADGQMIENLTSDFELECESFYYIQKSTLHQTSNTQGTFVPGHPVIAYHLKKNLFKECGFELENTIQFLTEQIVNIYYAGLVCVCKDAANYALIPPIILTPELTGTNNYIYSTDLKASEVIMWNPNNGLKTSVSGVILEGYDDASEITQSMIWDRVVDTKYYRRVNVNKSFSINDVIRNKVIVKFY